MFEDAFSLGEALMIVAYMYSHFLYCNICTYNYVLYFSIVYIASDKALFQPQSSVPSCSKHC